MTDAPVVLVTGGARRIGAAICHAFHRRGYRVLIHHRSATAEAGALAEEFNDARRDSARTLQADLTDGAAVARLAGDAQSAFARLDVLVNNASTFYATAVGDVTGEQWDELMDSNLRAAFFLSQSLVGELRRWNGTIINIVDTFADRPRRGHPVYSMAKAGLKAMTRALALELAPAIRVNGVAPGAMLWPAALEDEDDPEVLHTRQKIIDSIPLGELGGEHAVADAVCFLAEEASYMTGQVIKVDGGRSLTG